MNERTRRRASNGDLENSAPTGNGRRNSSKAPRRGLAEAASSFADAESAALAATRLLRIVVSPKENRLESLFVHELGADGRRVDPSGGEYIDFDGNNEGHFLAKVGRRYEFDWYLVGADDKAVAISFNYPDGSSAAKVSESKTKIRSGRGRSFGVMDLPLGGAIL